MDLSVFDLAIPMTGIFTDSLTFLIILQSDFPEYPCFCVLPCMEIAEAPAFSASFATSTAFILLSSIPFLIFIVIGIFTDLFNFSIRLKI